MKNKTVYIVTSGYDYDGDDIVDIFTHKKDAVSLIEKLKEEELKYNPHYKNENPYFNIITKTIK